MSNIEISEGRVFGSRYYVVTPSTQWIMTGSEPPYKGRWDELIDWCKETYGPTPADGIWTPNARWYVNNGKFWFRKESDRMLFLAKWV